MPLTLAECVSFFLGSIAALCARGCRNGKKNKKNWSVQYALRWRPVDNRWRLVGNRWRLVGSHETSESGCHSKKKRGGGGERPYGTPCCVQANLLQPLTLMATFSLAKCMRRRRRPWEAVTPPFDVCSCTCESGLAYSAPPPCTLTCTVPPFDHRVVIRQCSWGEKHRFDQGEGGVSLRHGGRGGCHKG